MKTQLQGCKGKKSQNKENRTASSKEEKGWQHNLQPAGQPCLTACFSVVCELRMAFCIF